MLQMIFIPFLSSIGLDGEASSIRVSRSRNVCQRICVIGVLEATSSEYRRDKTMIKAVEEFTYLQFSDMVNSQ